MAGDRINEAYAGTHFTAKTQRTTRERIDWIVSNVEGDGEQREFA